MTRTAAVGCGPALLGALDFGFFVLAAPGLAAELELGSAAWLFSAGSLAYGAVIMPAGTLLGRMAASRLLAAGLALAAAGVLLVAAADVVAAALAGRVLFGAGTGAAAAPGLVLLTQEEGSASFARMGGAIALGFSIGILLGASGAWRPSLLAIAALAIAVLAVATTLEAARPPRRADAVGALRFGAATAAAGLSLAVIPASTVAGAVVLVIAAALAQSAWRSVRRRLAGPRRDFAADCAAGAATTMSGVSAMVLLGAYVTGSPSHVDDLGLATFGLATLVAVGAARRLGRRFGSIATAAVGLAVQALAILALAVSPAVALVAVFGAAHVVANAGAASAAMRHDENGAATAAGLYVTAQYLAAGASPLVVHAMGVAAGVALAGAVVIVAVQRMPLTQSARRSAYARMDPAAKSGSRLETASRMRR